MSRKNKECLNCKKTFDGYRTAKFCSVECRDNNHSKLKFEKNNAKYVNKKEGVEYVTCAMCGLKGEKLQFHIQMVHGLSIEEYKVQYNQPFQCETQLQKQSERVRGRKNPAYNHGGKFSPFSNKFIHKDRIDKNALIQKMKDTKKNNPQNENTKIEYYLEQGMSEEEAQEALSERQRTFSLDICIEKYGKEIGRKVWSERQKKWASNYKKSNYSKMSQELFHQLKPFLLEKELYYAEHNGEKVLSIKERVVKPDLFYKNKIIEFDGDYWHGEKRGNQQRDEEKNQLYLQGGFEFLRIRERDYKNNKEETIRKCLNFLTQ